MDQFNMVKVFSATKHRERDALGFVRDYDGEVVDAVVRQSSDHEFHCLSIIIFGKDNGKRRRAHGRSRDQNRTTSPGRRT
jgi:hypothetical protein